MKSLHDITGQKFGRLTAVQLVAYSRTRRPIWQFRCDCGVYKDVLADSVRGGNTRSCGCLQREVTANRSFKHGGSPRSKREPLYVIWKHMRARCYNAKSKTFHRWGGRGIRVLWPDYQSFRTDMLRSYRPGLTIERIDNNGHYCKENCKWATPLEQARNTRRNVMLEFEGIRMNIGRWAVRIGLKRQALEWRIRSGWSVEKALTTPTRRSTRLRNGLE